MVLVFMTRCLGFGLGSLWGDEQLGAVEQALAFGKRYPGWEANLFDRLSGGVRSLEAKSERVISGKLRTRHSEAWAVNDAATEAPSSRVTLRQADGGVGHLCCVRGSALLNILVRFAE